MVAAVTKLADRGGSRAAAEGLGVPARIAGPFTLGLAAAELAVGVALLPAQSATAALIFALVLLSVFSAVAARAVARGEEPDCNCFGALSREPVGPRTLWRNAGLAALAVAALAFDDGTSAVAWLGGLDGRELGTVAAVLVSVALGAVCLALLRRHGRLLMRIDALEAERLTIAVVSRGSVSGTRARMDEFGLDHVLVQAGDAISLDYRVYGMPGAILVGADGGIAGEPVLGATSAAPARRSTPGSSAASV